MFQLCDADDISGILVLQEANLPDSGGRVSGAFLTEDWFEASHFGKIRLRSRAVGTAKVRRLHVSGTSLAGAKRTWQSFQDHVAQTSRRQPTAISWPRFALPKPNGEVSLAAAMFATLQKYRTIDVQRDGIREGR